MTDKAAKAFRPLGRTVLTVVAVLLSILFFDSSVEAQKSRRKAPTPASDRQLIANGLTGHVGVFSSDEDVVTFKHLRARLSGCNFQLTDSMTSRGEGVTVYLLTDIDISIIQEIEIEKVHRTLWRLTASTSESFTRTLSFTRSFEEYGEDTKDVVLMHTSSQAQADRIANAIIRLSEFCAEQ